MTGAGSAEGSGEGAPKPAADRSGGAAAEGFREGLRRRARTADRSVVLPEGQDPRVAAAAAEAVRERLFRPILLGDAEEVSSALRDAGADPGAVRLERLDDEALAGFVHELREIGALEGRGEGARSDAEEAAERARDPLVRAALLVRRGEADASVAGAVRPTGDVLRAALRCVGRAPDIRTVSSTFYMIVRPFRGGGPEVLSFTDGAVVPEPTPQQLTDIAVASVRARRQVVGDQPRVAFLSYSTHGSAAGAGVDRVVEALGLFRDRMPDVPCDGELQADAAIVPEVGRRKAPDSPVAGRANVLVFPDLDAGNIAYKLVERLCGATALGPVVQGLARPCSDVSRGAGSGEIVETACIAALMSVPE